MADEPDRLPPWVTWQQRPFPDANLLLLPGRNPALVDSGFAGHAGQTAELSVRLHRPAAAGRQHLLARRPRWRQRDTAGQGCGITGSVADADAVARRDPRCCQAEYLDQPVTPYTVDEQLHDSQILPLGDAEWQVICTPGHTPGHLCLWRPDERLLIADDALSDDVGWEHRTGRTRCRRDRIRMPGTVLNGEPRRTGTSACRLHAVAVSLPDAK